VKPVKTVRAILRLSALGLTLMAYVLFYRIRCLFKKHTIERGFRLRNAWIKLAFRILNLKIVEKKGKIPDHPCLYVINHRNLIDPVLIASLADSHFLAKSEIESYPFLGRGAAMTGVIYVTRDAKSSRAAARKTMRQTMKKGLNLAVYPEGTTGTDEFTITFHKGSFDEAAQLGVPVVPIAQEFKNKSDLWLEPSLLRQFLIQFGKKSTEVKVEIHEAIISDNATYLMRESRKRIDESLKRMHLGWHQVWGGSEGPEEHYETSIAVKAEAKDVFQALTKSIDNWWGNVEGPATSLNDEFKVSFGAESFWKFRVCELTKDQSVSWLCLESHQDHHLKGMDAEWIDTVIHWKIVEESDSVKIICLHEGLQPSGVCYDVCSAGWDKYIKESLRSYLENGKGKPRAF